MSSACREFWFSPDGKLAVPCPHCNGVVFFGTIYDWIPEWGGEPVTLMATCKGCKREWREGETPANFLRGDWWNAVGLDEMLARDGLPPAPAPGMKGGTP